MMSSRNQNRPPRSPSTKKDVNDDAPLDKRRRIGMSRTVGQMAIGPRRQPFSVINSRQDVPAAANASSTEVTESANVDFTKEDIEAFLNENKSWIAHRSLYPFTFTSYKYTNEATFGSSVSTIEE
ncbi:hypothetical protein FEM48_Zijuj08G0001300 [Ziziphus jujuba var. spinosa]|uniref:Uncharacterized protein n=1 Tax=Ziziphus jujuba var. spinosa TaxID=714518 RepID=A0A978UVW3_ZIZJJ|nr:hypothetical protein FEM48_Zijuj08G0001300 [Ziziphus jujuba var. spinosa]